MKRTAPLRPAGRTAVRPTVATALGALVAGLVLAGCGGGPSPYCAAVEENEATLSSFGKTRTNEAYTNYAEVFRTIADSAPASVKDDWTALADVTSGVVAAQDEIGISLEDVEADGKDLDEQQLASLNAAYEAFNSTNSQRDAVVKNVKIECEITIS